MILSSSGTSSDPDRLLSRGDALSCLEIIHQSLECQSAQGLCALMQRAADLIEAEYYACLINSKPSGLEAGRMVVLDAGFPAGWLDHYAQLDFHLVDPIVAENFSRFGLQYWADTYRKAPPPKLFLDEAEDAGLKRGFSFGVPDRSRTGGSLFSFSAPRLPRDPRSERILERVVPHLHRALCQVATGESILSAGSSLSLREQEVLKWTSVGKSSWEISRILRITERTVNFHIHNILGKLDAVNRVQAVAVALKLGLLDLP